MLGGETRGVKRASEFPRYDAPVFVGSRDRRGKVRGVAALLCVLVLANACRRTPRAAESAVRSAPAGGVASDARGVRYLALGDSFTVGTGASAEQSFPARLAARWRERGLQVELRIPARNGFTTQDVLDREIPDVAAFRPTIVTLAIGANDIVRGSDATRYRAQVRRIFAALAAAGVVGRSVVALPQPDWSSSPIAAAFGSPEDLVARIRAFNDVLREEVSTIGGRYVDLFPLMQRQARATMVADDGLHPNATAYDAWAEELARLDVPRTAP